MIQGKVKWFNKEKGIGFITAQGVDYFVHYSSIVSQGFKNLNDGQMVSFIPLKTDRGMSATEVHPLSANVHDDYPQ